MPAEDAAFYERALARITRIGAVLAVGGTGVAWMRGGWRSGLGFALGAALSGLSFLRWRKMADALGTQPTTSSAVLLVARLLLLMAAAFVIIKYFEVNAMAALVGLLTAAAAILIEILYELIYART